MKGCADAELGVCATILEANGCDHALVALVVKEGGEQQLQDLVLHW